MMNKVINLIYDRVGRGKSYECIRRMGEVVKRGEKAYLIVTNQSSYDAEKSVSYMLGGIGLNGAEVFSFERLLNHFEKTKTAKYLDSSGKQMLIYKSIKKLVAENAENEDKYSIVKKSYSNAGFMEIVSESIKEFKKYGITPESLENGDYGDNEKLKNKIDIIAGIYRNYNEFMNGGEGFLDSADNMARLYECIYSMPKEDFEGVHIFVDECYDFSSYQYKILETLAGKAESVNIFLCADNDAVMGLEDRTDMFRFDSIFAPSLKIINRIENDIAKLNAENDVKINVKKEYLDNPPYKYLKPEFYENADKYNLSEKMYLSESILLNEWNFDKAVRAVNLSDNDVEKLNSDIKLFEARDIFSEVEQAVLSVINLVNEYKYRYYDIGIFAGDIESYADIIEAVFKKYNVPYFIDTKKNIINHPIIMAINSIFDIFTNNWNYDSVFSYIRTGFSNISDDEADILENYVLKFGIRGEKVWKEEWNFENSGIFDEIHREKSEEKDNTEINNIRKKLITPFINFKESFNGKKKTEEICESIYNMLKDDIQIVYKIAQKAEKFRQDGRNDEAEQFSKLWNMFIALLDQIVVVMGEEYCTFEEFSEIITIGFSQCDIGIIPSSLDRVSIGTIERSRGYNYKVTMILGANSGNIPKAGDAKSYFTDAERECLIEKGFELDDIKKNRLYDEQFRIYKALTSAKEKSYISWSAIDVEGNALRLSEIVIDIRKRFPALLVSDNMLDIDINDYIHAPAEAVFSRMLTYWIDDKKEKSKEIRQWYKENRKELYDDAEKFRQYYIKSRIQKQSIEKDIVEKLFGEDILYSISQLETFAKCPFLYFMRYGIKAKPQKVWQVETYDVGTLVHYYMEQICDIINSGEKKGKEIVWKVNDEEVKSIYEDDFPENETEKVKFIWDFVGERLSDDKSENDISRKIIDILIKQAHKKIENKVASSVEYMLDMMQKTLTEITSSMIKSINIGEFVIKDRELRFGEKEEFRIGNVKIHGIIDRVDVAERDGKKYLRIIDYKTGSKSFDISEIRNKAEFQLFTYAQAAKEIYDKRDGNSDNQIAGVLYMPIRNKYENIDDFSDEEAIENELIKNRKFDGVVFDDEEYNVMNLMDRSFSENGNSGYYKVKLGKNSPDVHSMIICENKDNKDESKYKKICDYLNESIEEINMQIKSGNINIYPYKKANPCGYCDYKDICMFDTSNGKYRKSTGNERNFKAKVEEFIKEIDGKNNTSGKEEDGNE